MPHNKHFRKPEVPPCEQCSVRGSSIFCNLEESDLGKLSTNKTYSLYSKGQSIFYEGNIPHGIFCIYSGKVKIHKLGDDGKEQIVRFAKKGNVLGYRALLSGDSYYATATALEDTLVCFFPKNAFMEVLRNNPDFSLLTIRLLASDLKMAEHMITSMAQKHVDERVAEALLLLKECYGLEEDNMTINAVLTREEIASIAGTSTETAIRIISDLKNNKVINLDGKKIQIVAMNKLHQIANTQE